MTNFGKRSYHSKPLDRPFRKYASRSRFHSAFFSANPGRKERRRTGVGLLEIYNLQQRRRFSVPRFLLRSNRECEWDIAVEGR